MTRVVVVLGVVTGLLALVTERASAQSLGTFRWQLQPYCNVVSVTITQNVGVYRVEGTDDQCGAGRDQASVLGMAFPNPDGTIGFGMTIVTAPGGVPVHVDAEITVATLSGTWRDSAGGSGAFAFTPGAGTGGSPRPPATVIPASVTFAADGSFVARANGIETIPATGAGTRMMWYSGKGAFRAGAAVGTEWDDTNVGSRSAAFGTAGKASGRNSLVAGDVSEASGVNSMAFGFNTTASGAESLAFGFVTKASGSGSLAFGDQTIASGIFSTALGRRTTASGEASLAAGGQTLASGAAGTALGVSTTASGLASMAIGSRSSASGSNSVAAGNDSRASGPTSLAFGLVASASGQQSVALGTRATTTAGATGSFVFADASGDNPFTSFVPNQFIVRAAGGLGVYTNAATTTGAEMAPGGGAWAALSDATMKENFRDVDGEDLLAKLAGVPVREWNYTSQDARIRHLGPTAQDFRAAFGLGEFERRITSTDADGVALAAVKALDERTRRQGERVETLERQLADALDALRALRHERR